VDCFALLAMTGRGSRECGGWQGLSSLPGAQ
jgi:hypothetical protein